MKRVTTAKPFLRRGIMLPPPMANLTFIGFFLHGLKKEHFRRNDTSGPGIAPKQKARGLLGQLFKGQFGRPAGQFLGGSLPR